MSRNSRGQKNQEDSQKWGKEVNGEKPMEWALELLKTRQNSDVLKRSIDPLREASFGKLEDGQPDDTPTIDPEPLPAKKKAASKKGILLVTAENIENPDFRFTAGSASQAEIALHIFGLKCHYKERKGPFCGEHVAFRATSQECHKNLDMEDMSMPYIEQLDPINFLCLKRLEASGLEGELWGESSLHHIREDMRVNEIIVCDPSIRKKIAERVKNS